VFHASTHKCIGSTWSCNITLASPRMLQLFLLATPFGCGLWGAVNSFQMPSFAHKFLNSFDTYSPLLSLLRAFTFLLVYFLTSALNSTNLEKVSSFFCMKKIQHFGKKSSIKMRKYLCLEVEAFEKFLPTLEWILSRIACVMLSRSWKVDFVFFPKVHPLHVSCFFSAPLGRPVVIHYMIFKA